MIKIDEKFINEVKELAAKNYANQPLRTKKDNLLTESYISAVLSSLASRFDIHLEVRWEPRHINKDPE